MATLLDPLAVSVTGEPKGCSSTMNCTVPVGAVEPVAGATVAVNVTLWLYVGLAGEEVTVVVVATEHPVMVNPTGVPLPAPTPVTPVGLALMLAV